MRVITCKRVRRASNIATVAQLLSHGCVDLKRQPVSKYQMGRLQCTRKRRNDDIPQIKVIDLGPRALCLRFPQRRDGGIENHRVRLIRIVHRVKGRLSVSNKVNGHCKCFRMLGIVE